MCGIAGYVRASPGPGDGAVLERLLEGIRERGPDGEGICLVDGAGGTAHAMRTDGSPAAVGGLPHFRAAAARTPHDVVLVHARYAVIDPTAAGHQPFHGPDGDVVVAFNGELFNHPELRADLEAAGHRFRTATDTEVLLHAYRHWGDEAWERLNGFWAAVVYDRRRRALVLSRDRLGIAPLYLARDGDTLHFGSSPLAVAGMLPGGARPRRDRVAGFVETGLRDIDGHTLFEGVRALEPGTSLAVPLGASGRAPVATRFWQPPTGRLTTADLSLADAAASLRETLTSAVEYRLRADRPVAFQLSGGLDSTSVVALAAGIRAEPLPTFTVSVPEADEDPLAAEMARRYRLDRTVLTDLEVGLLDDPVALARLMAEPVHAPAALAHHAMCRRIKEAGSGVTLSGSGGDEALAGYAWDFWPSAKRALRAEGHGLQASVHQLFFEGPSPRALVRGAAHRLAALRAGPAGADGAARGTVPQPERSGDGHAEGAVARAAAALPGLDYDAARLHHLRVAHLPYYLASNDRATLGVPLEHRQPFLDHRVVELGLRMPPAYLFRRGWTKYVLRVAMEPLLPRRIVWRRPKTGFPFPFGRLRQAYGPLLEAAAARARAAGYGSDDAPSAGGAPTGPDRHRLWRACSVGMWLDAIG